MTAEIPVVDFASYSSFNGENIDETSDEIKKISQEIYDAFTTIGFVYIKNHGIPESERHRVAVPRAKVFHSKPRQYVVFFVRPDNDVLIECLDGSNHYPAITALEYTKQRFSATYDLKK